MLHTAFTGATAAHAARRLAAPADPLRRDADLPALCSAARASRDARGDFAPVGAAVITLDNHCVNDCAYCPFARSNRSMKRYQLAPERLFADAGALARAGYNWLLVQMGQVPAGRLLRWSETFTALREQAPALRLMVGAGEQTEGTMRELAEAGVDAYAISLECADDALFKSLRPVGLYARRRFAVRSAMLAGLRVASGLTVGLPGETEDQLAQSVAEAVETAPDIVIVNVFSPCAGSRLPDAPPPSDELVARTIASLRLALPDRLLLAGCPAPADAPPRTRLLLDAGADGALLNIDTAATFPQLAAE